MKGKLKLDPVPSRPYQYYRITRTYKELPGHENNAYPGLVVGFFRFGSGSTSKAALPTSSQAWKRSASLFDFSLEDCFLRSCPQCGHFVASL